MARYWVGGTGNWSDNTNHWASSSGGAPGASLPTSTDDVIFDSSSHTAGYTVTINATASCRDFTMGNPAAGSPTLAGSNTLQIYGSFQLVSGMTRTFSGNLQFLATSTGKTITFNSVGMGSNTTFNGVGGGWTLQDNFSNSAGTITLTNGALDTNGVTVTCVSLSSSNSNTRTLTLGASTINTTSVTFTTTTNLTFNSNTSSVNLSGSSSTQAFGSLTWYNVTLAPTAAANMTLTGAASFNNLTYTGSANKTDRVSITDSIAPSTFVVAGNSLTNRAWIKATTPESPVTITAATTTLSNADFSDVTAAGAGSWSGTSLGDAGGNTGITFTTPVTRYWVGGTGNYSSTGEWSTSSGGGTGASVPLCHDTVVFDSNSFTAANTITLDMQRYPTLDFTNATNTPAVTYGTPTGGLYILGGLNLTSTGTITAQQITYIGRSSYSIVSNGKTSATTVVFSGLSSTYTLTDAFVASSTMAIYRGSVIAQSDVTATNMDSAATTTRAITMGSGTWTLSGTGNTWTTSVTTGLTFSGASATIKFTNSSASAKTFAGGGLTYGTFWVATGSTGTTTVSGSNTFSVFKSDVGRSIILTASTTQTVTTASGMQITGSAGNLVTITSTSATNASFSVASGTVSVDYVSLTDNTATGGATFYAGANSTNGGDNPGWTFTAPPATSSKSTSLLMGV